MKIIIEIRPGTGGKEAEKFMHELSNAYIKYSNKHNINFETKASGRTFLLYLSGSQDSLKVFYNESGVHKVQRVTQMGGNKVHTFTVSVAVMVPSPPSPISIDEKDLRIKYYRGHGNGGQKRNKTDSAVRITHLPTGIVVICENERSQHQNKIKAKNELIRRLTVLQTKKQAATEDQYRLQQVLGNNFSEARRTYNYIRNSVVDHITGKSISIKEFL